MKYMFWIIPVIVLLGICAYLSYWVRHNVTYTARPSSQIADKICSSFPKNYGYVVDEYRNDGEVIGGFIAYSMKAAGSSTYNYDANGKQLAAITPLPASLNSLEGKSAMAWQNNLIKNFPVKTTYECGKL